MFEINETKRYKFSLGGADIAVDTDGSFNDFAFSCEPDIVSYIEYRHYHMACELFLIEDTPITLLADNKSETFQNCILIIPPKFNHLSLRKRDYRFLFSFSKGKKSNFTDFLQSLCDSTVPVRLNTDTQIISYTRELAELIGSKDAMSEEIVVSLLKLIFHRMYMLNTVSSPKMIPTKNESYILQIDNIINSFQNHIDLQTVADALHLGKKQTSRIIAKTYNKSLSQLLTEKRLNAACMLLCHTDKSISEIVEYINFPSESYFYSQFKKAYGCTPLKYKAICKNRTS